MVYSLDALSIYFRIYIPFAIVFYGNILPVKMIILDFGKNPLSSFIINERKNYVVILLLCFKSYYFSCITISDIPCVCIRIIDFLCLLRNF